MTLHRFTSEPPLGTVILLDGQRYDLVGCEPYERKDGQESRLLTWATECVDCGEQFTCNTGLVVGSLNRRCIRHKRPGCRVDKRRPRGEPLEVSVRLPRARAAAVEDRMIEDAEDALDSQTARMRLAELASGETKTVSGAALDARLAALMDD